MEKEKNPKSLKIEFSGIDSTAVGELMRFFKAMEWCGKVGASRTLKFFADGDGAFRPHISSNLPWEDEIEVPARDSKDDFPIFDPD